MEDTRALLLARSLELLRPRSTRPAWALKQRDKVSSAWLLALPGFDKSLSSAEFADAAASNLCLPSPACTGRVGEVIKGRVTVDEYGDNVQATCLPGDHWRTRHNQILHLLHRLCMWAGLPVQMEVFNLFSGLVRQEGLSRVEAARQRQALVPDMRIAMPDPNMAGNMRPILHELKCISASKSRYKPTWERRAVDMRAAKLQQEYLDKARAADRNYGGAQLGEVGRVEAKLVSLGTLRGLMCGNWGEVSEDTHALVSALATSRIRVAGPSWGRRGRLRAEEGERAVVVGSIRRRLGVATIRAQCHSLLGRLECLGPGCSAAAGHRRQAQELDRRWRLEQQAASLSARLGWRIQRSGFARLN